MGSVREGNLKMSGTHVPLMPNAQCFESVRLCEVTVMFLVAMVFPSVCLLVDKVMNGLG